MSEQLKVELTDHADFALSTLHEADRRRVEAWFEHLRHWRSDDDVRSRSRRLAGDDDEYLSETGFGYVVAFRVEADRVKVMSIYRKETLELVAAAGSRGK